MVRPEGFEPPTNGFGSHYSIRLSYERVLVLSGRRLPGLASQPRGVRCETGILSTFAEQIFPP